MRFDAKHGNAYKGYYAAIREWLRQLRLKLAGRTDRGRVRPSNEDAYYAWVAQDGANRSLCIVADGMGGSNAGEIASEMAVATIAGELRDWLSHGGAASVLDASRAAGDDVGDASEHLMQAVLAANNAVYAAGRRDRDLQGMGTTVTAALILGGRMSIVHVGDSRGLLLRDSQLRQLTLDHSLVAELIRNGALTEQEAVTHPHRNVLTRALGTEQLLTVDIHEESLEPGDVVILCSDGVTRHLEPSDFSRFAGGAACPAAVADSLVDLALERGGHDNLTCVVILCERCCAK